MSNLCKYFYYLFLHHHVNDERPTEKKNTTIEWDDRGKTGNKNKFILIEIFSSVHET